MRLVRAALLVVGLAALAGCVVVPVGPRRAYLAAPHVAVVAPAPFVAVRPYHYYGP